MLTWTEDEALRWMEAAGGRLHRRSGTNAGSYAVLLRMPAMEGSRGRLIVAFGESISEAVEAARTCWDAIWREVPRN